MDTRIKAHLNRQEFSVDSFPRILGNRTTSLCTRRAQTTLFDRPIEKFVFGLRVDSREDVAEVVARFKSRLPGHFVLYPGHNLETSLLQCVLDEVHVEVPAREVGLAAEKLRTAADAAEDECSSGFDETCDVAHSPYVSLVVTRSRLETEARKHDVECLPVLLRKDTRI